MFLSPINSNKIYKDSEHEGIILKHDEYERWVKKFQIYLCCSSAFRPRVSLTDRKWEHYSYQSDWTNRSASSICYGHFSYDIVRRNSQAKEPEWSVTGNGGRIEPGSRFRCGLWWARCLLFAFRDLASDDEEQRQFSQAVGLTSAVSHMFSPPQFFFCLWMFRHLLHSDPEDDDRLCPLPNSPNNQAIVRKE